MLSLDEDELRAAATLLTGIAPDGDLAASVALGTVRLRARGLLSGPDALSAADLADSVRRVLDTWLSSDVRVSVNLVRRGDQSEIGVYRRGGTFVAHRRDAAADGELHSFVSFPTVQAVADYVLEPLDAPPQAHTARAHQLGLHALERARSAAAAGDRAGVACALGEAGADAALIEQLADALLAPRCVAQLQRMSEPRRNLTLLVGATTLWTLTHAGAGDTTIGVDRPTLDALREQIGQLWAT